MDTPKELPGRLTLTSDGTADDVSLEEGPSGLCWPVTTYEYRIVDGVLNLVIEAQSPTTTTTRTAKASVAADDATYLVWPPPGLPLVEPFSGPGGLRELRNRVLGIYDNAESPEDAHMWIGSLAREIRPEPKGE